MSNTLTVALAGNPNCGKTTLFNTITGARQHVGNYPGITVDRKEGSRTHQGREIRFVDLPGTYSLSAYSMEELVARDFIVNEKPDALINVVDAANLERNLYLSVQLMELGLPLVLALNMMDVAKARGLMIDDARLAALLHVPVVPIVARSGQGVDALLDTVLALADNRDAQEPLTLNYGADIEEAIKDLAPGIDHCTALHGLYPRRWLALKLLEHDSQIMDKARESAPDAAPAMLARAEALAAHMQSTLAVYPEAVIADQRYGYIKAILRQGVLSASGVANRLYTSDRIDLVVTHRLLGPIIMALVLFGLYSFTFGLGSHLVGLTESLFGLLNQGLDALLPDGPLKSMLMSGVVDGVGGVLGFVPLIMFMFFGIALLEDSGYLARVAFMMDRIFHFFGLHGSSVMPFIIAGGIAGGCAVPGVMAARTLRSPRERLATLLTVPFMNCGAKLPVLTLLIGAFFPTRQAWYLFLATIIAWTVALCVAKFLRSTVLRGASTPFVMELPPYRFPTLRGLLIHTWERTWQYIKKAGTVILGISILLWALMSYPGLPDAEQAKFAAQKTAIDAQFSGDASVHKAALQELEAQAATAQLRNSMAGRLGTALEPLSELAGIDWRTNIALVGGFAAKEVIVSTLGTAYSLGQIAPEEAEPLSQRLVADPGWNALKACAVLVFIMFYTPCLVTVVCIAREAGSWKWAAFSMAFNTAFAYLLAVLTYQIGRIFV